jgi:NifB/MoaA-like Fe-S oxidoreductase
LTYLTQNGIEIYTQAVICPGLNEGSVLEQTMQDLVKLYPGVKALGIVPVGLTQYQSRLKNMQTHTVAQARETIALIEKYQTDFIRQYGHPFMQIADEFYLKAELAVPPKEHYSDFQLLENGIGGIRQFIDSFSDNYDPEEIAPQNKVAIITGKDGAFMFREYILPIMSPKHRQKLEILEIENQHFGNSVTVSGLMVGSDIVKQIKPGTAHRYLLPSNCLKFDTPVFLDDLAVPDLEKHLGAEITILNPGAVDLLEGIFEA